MANFPGGLDTFTNPSASATLAAVPHHTQHTDANDAIEAIEAKIGTGSSTPTAGALLTGSGTGTSSWGYTPIAIGTGDEISRPGVSTSGQLLRIKRGTDASPDTNPHPLVKIEHWADVPETDLEGDGSSQLASLAVFRHSSGTNQPVAIYGYGSSDGTANGDEGRYPDATGGYFVGEVKNSGISRGIGFFAIGKAMSTSSYGDGGQIAVQNGQGSNHSVNSTGISRTTGLWITPIGDRCGAGVQLGNGFNSQFDVGFHVNGQVSADFTGAAYTAAFRDDSNAINSYQARGAHTTVLNLSAATGTSIWLPNAGDDTTGTGRVIATDMAGSGVQTIMTYRSDGNLRFDGETGIISRKLHSFLAGIHVGTQDIVTDTTTGTKIGTSTSQKLGFFNATPIVKPTGVAVSAAGIHAALVSLGLIAA